MIAQHMPDHAPHVVPIDMEGVDLPFVRSLDASRLAFDDRAPSLICAEAHGYPSDWLAILEPHRYSISARTPDNLILRCDPGLVPPEALAGIRTK
jgi:hypothetical protein